MSSVSYPAAVVLNQVQFNSSHAPIIAACVDLQQTNHHRLFKKKVHLKKSMLVNLYEKKIVGPANRYYYRVLRCAYHALVDDHTHHHV